eukprot:g4375.t1
MKMSCVECALVIGMVHMAGAITIESCEWRNLPNVEQDQGTLSLTEFKCTTDEDLYLKSVKDPNIVLKSTSNASVVEDALLASSISWPTTPGAGGYNFQAATLDPSGDPNRPPQIIPNALFSLAGNVNLVCGNKVMPALPSHFYPTNHLYMTKPIANPVTGLWQGFGAYKFPTPLVDRSFTFLIMNNLMTVQGPGGVTLTMTPTFTAEELKTCSDNGELKVTIAAPQATSCSEANGCFRSAGECDETTTPGSCYPWKFANSDGTLIPDGTSVTVEETELSCDLAVFEAFAADRLPKLYHLLQTATTKPEQDAALMTQWASCKEPFDSFYKTRSVNKTLKNAKICINPADQTDPCCDNSQAQRKLRWTDCCIAQDRDITIAGVFDKANSEAIDAQCSAKGAQEVKTIIDQVLGDVLMAANHPESGCSARNRKILSD